MGRSTSAVLPRNHRIPILQPCYAATSAAATLLTTFNLSTYITSPGTSRQPDLKPQNGKTRLRPVTLKHFTWLNKERRSRNLAGRPAGILNHFPRQDEKHWAEGTLPGPGLQGVRSDLHGTGAIKLSGFEASAYANTSAVNRNPCRHRLQSVKNDTNRG